MRTHHLACVGVLIAFGCGDGGTDPGPVAASIDLAPASPDTLFALGDSVELQATVLDDGGRALPGAVVTFHSSDSGVAIVDAAGLVTSTGNGAATVTATSGPASASLEVRVRQKLEGVSVEPATVRLVVERTAILTATPTDRKGHPIEGLPPPVFTSDDAAVTRADTGGVITAIAPGATNITATVTSSADGTRMGSAEVTVVAEPPDAATVGMTEDRFVPETVDIVVGGSVRWVNGSGVLHDVDFGDPEMRIPPFDSGEHSLTFSSAGTFPYHCNLHSGMEGTVEVH